MSQVVQIMVFYELANEMDLSAKLRSSRREHSNEPTIAFKLSCYACSHFLPYFAPTLTVDPAAVSPMRYGGGGQRIAPRDAAKKLLLLLYAC